MRASKQPKQGKNAHTTRKTQKDIQKRRDNMYENHCANDKNMCTQTNVSIPIKLPIPYRHGERNKQIVSRPKPRKVRLSRWVEEGTACPTHNGRLVAGRRHFDPGRGAAYKSLERDRGTKRSLKKRQVWFVKRL